MIAIDVQTFQQSREGGNVTGVIFLELPDGAYPENAWSDFPVIILGWWAVALLELEVPTRRKVQWQFMDGPHHVTLTKEAGPVSTGAFELSQVRGSLLEVAERVVAHCDRYKIFSRDLETLRGNIQQLKANKLRLSTGRAAGVTSDHHIILALPAVAL
jgi:hypothetical protein